jgi:Fe-S-cluster-containing dehydrogenase component
VPLGVWRTQVRFYEKGVYPRVKRHFFSIICDHCHEAPCIEASENNGVGSFYKTEDGITLIDYKKLKGRTPAQIKVETDAAIESCPLESVFMNPDTGLPEKCTFCAHRVAKGLTPACCQTCLGRSRVFGDLSDPDSPVAQLLARNASRTLMPEDDGGGAGVYYIGLEAGATDYGAMEGGKQMSSEDLNNDVVSMTSGPRFKGWTPETKVGE